MKKIEKQVEEYIEYCANIRRLSPRTIETKVWIYQNLLEEVKVDSVEQITNNDIMQWITTQTKRGCAGRTINIRLVNFIAMVHYFQDMGVGFPGLRVNLIPKVNEMPPRRVFYTREQIAKVLKFSDRLEWLLISLSYDCGLRIAELRNLRIRNFHGRCIQFIGKGSKAREAYMSEETRARLNDWIESEGITDYLWAKKSSKNGEPLCAYEIRYRMRRAFERAGFLDFYPHSLRHSFATNICDNGAPLPVAQKMLGHSSLSTTERYVHTFDGHLKQYFDQYKFATA